MLSNLRSEGTSMVLRQRSNERGLTKGSDSRFPVEVARKDAIQQQGHPEQDAIAHSLLQEPCQRQPPDAEVEEAACRQEE